MIVLTRNEYVDRWHVHAILFAVLVEPLMREIFERKQILQIKNSQLYLDAKSEIQNNLELYKSVVQIHHEFENNDYSTDWVFDLPVFRLSSMIDVLTAAIEKYYAGIFFPLAKVRSFLARECDDGCEETFKYEDLFRMLYIYTELRAKILHKKKWFGVQDGTNAQTDRPNKMNQMDAVILAEIDLINSTVFLFSDSLKISTIKSANTPWDLPRELKTRYSEHFKIKFRMTELKMFEILAKIKYIEDLIDTIKDEQHIVFETLISFKFNDRFGSIKFIDDDYILAGNQLEVVKNRMKELERAIFEKFNDEYKSVLFMSYIVFVCPDLRVAVDFGHLKSSQYYYFLKWTEY